jgi:uncharacterized protein (UPF0332 family)
MKMSFERLLSEEKIEKVEKTEIDLDSVEKDLKFAQVGMETDYYNRVMAIAYEAVLKAGNKLMNFLGYRAIGKEHHKNLFEFLKETDINKELVVYFDKIRKKRNDFVYRDIESVDKSECEQIIGKAKEFVQEIRTFVQKNSTNQEGEK